MYKELFDHKGLSIVIVDSNNYGVYDKDKPIIRWGENGKEISRTYKYSYFSNIEFCVKYVAKQVSNRQAQDLKSWLESYKELIIKLEKLIKE